MVRLVSPRLLLVVAALAASCTAPPPPVVAAPTRLPTAPDAVLVVAAPSIGAVQRATSTWGARIGADGAALAELVPSALSLAGVASSARAVLSVRPVGGMIAAVDVEDAAALRRALEVLAQKDGARLVPLLRATTAVVDKEGVVTLLVHVANGRAVVVVSPVDALAEAALAEAMGAAPGLASPLDDVVAGLPADDAVLRFAGGPDLQGVLGPGLFGGLWRDAGARGVAGALVAQDDGAHLDARILIAGEAGGWLAAAAPPHGACALDEGAALTLRVPAALGEGKAEQAGLPIPTEAALRLQGQLAVALYPATRAGLASDPLARMGLVVLGTPRPGAKEALRASLAANGRAATTTTRTVGGRTITDVAPASSTQKGVGGGTVHAIVDDDLFALALGDALPVDRVATTTMCPPEPPTAMRLYVDGRQAQALVAGPAGIAAAALSSLFSGGASTAQGLLPHVRGTATLSPGDGGARMEADVRLVP